MILELEAAVEELRAGAVVAYPTETVYGLGADALSAAAVGRLRRLKRRDPESGLSVLVGSPEQLERYVPGLPARAAELAREHWPGPLTLVLPGPDESLAAVATPLGVGFRCSPHPTAAALVAAFGGPLVSTSANFAGKPPCARAAEVERVFGPRLPVAVGGAAGGLAASTVVAVSARGELRTLRPGPVSLPEAG
ncbi:MAG: threonylcarbamoyl-AMP synthase [Proteobacteria bacterium]|nr:threonylcarbamoyl-AMP synthase [Pseudomonadota bacterium]